MTDPATSQTMVDRAVAEFGRLDVFYANAGGAMPTPALEIDIAEYKKVIALDTIPSPTAFVDMLGYRARVARSA